VKRGGGRGSFSNKVVEALLGEGGERVKKRKGDFYIPF